MKRKKKELRGRPKKVRCKKREKVAIRQRWWTKAGKKKRWKNGKKRKRKRRPQAKVAAAVYKRICVFACQGSSFKIAVCLRGRSRPATDEKQASKRRGRGKNRNRNVRCTDNLGSRRCYWQKLRSTRISRAFTSEQRKEREMSIDMCCSCFPSSEWS